MNEKEKQVGK